MAEQKGTNQVCPIDSALYLIVSNTGLTIHYTEGPRDFFSTCRIEEKEGWLNPAMVTHDKLMDYYQRHSSALTEAQGLPVEDWRSIS